MTIRTVHQVINKSGTVIGEFMDIKLAKDLDNRTDVLYFIADLVETAGLDEATAEKVAEIMINDNTRKELLSQLKTVKDLPAISEENNSL
jgi:predicted ABC-type transport system involved in lysophospholipase L1 biosynthesis ATPase subunit